MSPKVFNVSKFVRHLWIHSNTDSPIKDWMMPVLLHKLVGIFHSSVREDGRERKNTIYANFKQKYLLT